MQYILKCKNMEVIKCLENILFIKNTNIIHKIKSILKAP